MSNFYRDNDDLRYYFERGGLDWEPLVRLTEYDYRAPDGFKSAADALPVYQQIAEMVGEFAGEEIAPHTAQLDRDGVRLEDGEAVVGPKFEAIFEQIKALELHGLCAPRELGGMQCPVLLQMILSEVIARADASVMTHHGFHGGMAMAMLYYSVIEGSSTFDVEGGRIATTRFEKEIREIVRGDAWGCMDITEPDAGSDMARLRAVGEQDADGSWFVSGQKIFITSGHGKHHFVIARTEKVKDPDDPMSGLKGLSMFLVPTYEETAKGKRKRIVPIDRVEEKLGHHASVTASLSFDRAPAHLIGERGEGFKHMLTLMNNARVGVGFESIGVCEAALRVAREYAAERPSMGKTIDRHEMIADYLDEMATDIQAVRALAMYGGFNEEMAQKLGLQLSFFAPDDEVEKKRIERQQKRHAASARRVTPLIKYVGAEKAVEMARRAVQILGGNGYSAEYPAEKLLRDALVLPIYEGTSQIQALMAMKDCLMGIMKDPRAFVRRQAQARWRALSAKDPQERRVAKVQVLAMGAQNHLMAKTATDKLKSLSGKPIANWPKAFLKNWDPKRDFAFAMLHAERLTKLLADEAICELLLAQAQRAPERREVLERYLDRAEPRCRFLHDEITTTGKRMLTKLAAAEAEAAAAAG